MTKPARVSKQVLELYRDDSGKLRKPSTLERLFSGRVVLVTLKRECASGKFVEASRRAMGCAIKPRQHTDWTRLSVRGERPCWGTKAQALAAFRDANPEPVERWGLSTKASGGEFDSINEKYGLRGARRVVTLRAAIEAAAPVGAPYCLDRFDLDALNDTSPGREFGPFRLPDVVHDWKAWEASRSDCDGGCPHLVDVDGDGSDVPF